MNVRMMDVALSLEEQGLHKQLQLNVLEVTTRARRA